MLEENEPKNSIAQFLNKISKYPVLSKKEEQEVTRIIQKKKKKLLYALAETPYFTQFLQNIHLRMTDNKKAYLIVFTGKLSSRKAGKLLSSIIEVLTRYQSGEGNDREIHDMLKETLFNWPRMLSEGLIDEIEKFAENYDKHQAYEISPSIELTYQQAQDILSCYNDLRADLRKFESHNLKLIVSIAKRYRLETLMDRIQWGYPGLRQASWRFDPDTGYKFSTYATWWIRQSISREISNKAHLIRTPVHVLEKIGKLNKIRRQRKDLFTEDVACKELQASPDEYKELLTIERQLNLSSLDELIGNPDEGTNTLLDYLESTQNGPLEELAQTNHEETVWDEIYLALEPREADIIVKRHLEERTLEDVGSDYNLSRERIRQIEAKALKKLVNNKVFRRLFEELT